MTFGQGCLPTETLPFKLERVLNTSLWDQQIEVVNGGICGYSIYDAWRRYLDKFERYRPDLVIVTVCDNDAELYPQRESTNKREQSKSYGEFSQDCFDPQGEHFPYFRQLLLLMANHTLNGGPKVMIAFYDIHGGLNRDRILHQLHLACREANLPFADLSAEFVGNASALHNKLLRVSEADAHPSALAHDIASRCLARYIIAQKMLGKIELTPSTAESALLVSCSERADILGELSGNPIGAIDLLWRFLAAKQDSRTRLQLEPEDLTSEKMFEKLRAEIQHVARRWIMLRIWESWHTHFRFCFEQVNCGLNLVGITLSRLSKTLLVLQERAANPELPGVSEFRNLSPVDPPPVPRSETASNRLAKLRSNVQLARQFAINCFSIESEPSTFLPRINNVIRINSVECSRQVLPYLDALEQILDSVERQFAIFTILERTESVCVRSMGRAAQLMESTVDQTEHCITAANLEILSRLVDPTEMAILSNLTKISITLTSPKSTDSDMESEPWLLELQVNPIAPFGRIISDIQVIVRDGQSRVYCFSLPLFIDAEICIGIRAGQQIKLEKVRLATTTDRVVSLTAKDFIVEQEGKVYRRSHLLLPV